MLTRSYLYPSPQGNPNIRCFDWLFPILVTTLVVATDPLNQSAWEYNVNRGSQGFMAINNPCSWASPSDSHCKSKRVTFNQIGLPQLQHQCQTMCIQADQLHSCKLVYAPVRAWILVDKGGEWPRCKHGTSSSGKQHQTNPILPNVIICLSYAHVYSPHPSHLLRMNWVCVRLNNKGDLHQTPALHLLAVVSTFF